MMDNHTIILVLGLAGFITFGFFAYNDPHSSKQTSLSPSVEVACIEQAIKQGLGVKHGDPQFGYPKGSYIYSTDKTGCLAKARQALRPASIFTVH